MLLLRARSEPSLAVVLLLERLQAPRMPGQRPNSRYELRSGAIIGGCQTQKQGSHENGKRPAGLHNPTSMVSGFELYE